MVLKFTNQIKKKNKWRQVVTELLFTELILKVYGYAPNIQRNFSGNIISQYAIN